MITELGKKCLCPVLLLPPYQLSFDFSRCTRGSVHSHGITLSTFYPWFWLKLLVLFWPLISKQNFSLLFFLELQGLWSLRSPCGCFHSIFCRITFSGPCLSFISALSIWLTFISVLTEVAVLQLNFTSLLSSSYCMCFCVQRHLQWRFCGNELLSFVLTCKYK